MKDNDYNLISIQRLVRLQRYTWLFFVGYFVLVGILSFFNVNVATTLTFWGIILLLVVTIMKLIVIAEQFRIARLYRFKTLSYLLILVLLLIVVFKYLAL